MNRYIIRRILQSLPVLLGISIITFTFAELAPGDVVSAMVGQELGTGGEGPNVEELRAQLGLDQPAPVRYAKWLGSFLRGNMGRRLGTRALVSEEIGRHVVPTLELMTTSLLISVVLGILLGVASALKQYSLFDYVSTAFVFLAISVPAFFAALGAIYIFSVHLKWFPTSGYSVPGASSFGPVRGFLSHLRYLILPASLLGLESVASIMRYVRASMLETLRVDYVIVARSKGLHERTVIFRHAFRNAVLPVVTIIGLRLPSLFGGTLIIETIFNWPGLAILYMSGVSMRDYPLIMALTMISATVIVLSNLITDIAYGFVDPRIRYE